jgi:hypothetical protein
VPKRRNFAETNGVKIVKIKTGGTKLKEEIGLRVSKNQLKIK